MNDGPFEVLWRRAQHEIPGAKIIMKKDSYFMKFIFGILKGLAYVFTFGKARKDAWDGFTTTIGRRVYVPNSWEKKSSAQKYMTLRHELVHLRQFRNWPMKFIGRKGLWRINAVIMGFCYLLILPVFFTFRAKFEREGYAQSMLVRYELYNQWDDPKEQVDYAEWMAKVFGTSTYMWMWTKDKARRWANQVMSDIVDGKITNYQDRVTGKAVKSLELNG